MWKRFKIISDLLCLFFCCVQRKRCVYVCVIGYIHYTHNKTELIESHVTILITRTDTLVRACATFHRVTVPSNTLWFILCTCWIRVQKKKKNRIANCIRFKRLNWYFAIFTSTNFEQITTWPFYRFATVLRLEKIRLKTAENSFGFC